MASNVSYLLAKAKYRYQDQAKRHITNVITNYRGLEPKLEKYTFTNGKEKELVALSGTIPVNFRGKYYHFPVCLFINDTYPYSPPVCYVRPTPEMCIKESKYVDASGTIFLPYLSDWDPNTSDLLGVIQVMIILFGETPPVYQKPKNVPPNPANSYNQPAYPASTDNISIIDLEISGYPARYPAVGNPSSATYMPPQPPTANYPNPPYPTQFPFSQYPGSGATAYPPVSTYGEVSSHYPAAVSSPGTGTITEEHIRASLLSAVEDKLKERLKEKLGQLQAEVDVLRQTSEDLNKGKAKLEEIMTKIENETVELEDTKRELVTKNSHLSNLITKHESDSKNVEIDDAFGPNEPLYKQLLNAFAEENAVVDAIYYMGEALRKGVIDLEVFLRNIRELSRRQFMLRALMQKCREKAGLPNH
ncbi:tumor susceptibility protein-like protein [Leptotrombidium deliense]|uniref:Tumor susceptibility protein-like protein n=1 Tax=Leptotrombidium deliense TaxID=299467 RepID=A0A443SU03_9ACAR|nr:tumor susceptibility protein-like protein [Leptotrombidium deliense]